MTAGKIASQAFQACERMLRAASAPDSDPGLHAKLRTWTDQGTRTICRVAETSVVFKRVCREVPGITVVDEGLYGCPPGSATIHASWPTSRRDTPRMLTHKRVPLLATPTQRRQTEQSAEGASSSLDRLSAVGKDEEQPISGGPKWD
jgi:hypothetical protein